MIKPWEQELWGLNNNNNNKTVGAKNHKRRNCGGKNREG